MPAVGLGRAPRYHSYLLRCWSEGPGVWRFSVEDPHTGKRRGFTEMAALIAFLETTLCDDGDEESAVQDASRAESSP